MDQARTPPTRAFFGQRCLPKLPFRAPDLTSVVPMLFLTWQDSEVLRSLVGKRFGPESISKSTRTASRAHDFTREHPSRSALEKGSSRDEDGWEVRRWP